MTIDAPAVQTSLHRFKRRDDGMVRWFVLVRDAATGELIIWGGPYTNHDKANAFARVFDGAPVRAAGLGTLAHDPGRRGFKDIFPWRTIFG